MVSELKFVLVVTITNRPLLCYRMDGEQVQIGRGKNNHLRLEEEAVSKTHCEFFKSPETGLWQFRDLGSTNGSKLNGEKVGTDSVSIKEGDEIDLGKVIKLHYLSLRALEEPESLEEEEDDPDVNPVAAAVARQVREDMEETQLIKLPTKKK